MDFIPLVLLHRNPTTRHLCILGETFKKSVDSFHCTMTSPLLHCYVFTISISLQTLSGIHSTHGLTSIFNLCGSYPLFSITVKAPNGQPQPTDTLNPVWNLCNNSIWIWSAPLSWCYSFVLLCHQWQYFQHPEVSQGHIWVWLMV